MRSVKLILSIFPFIPKLESKLETIMGNETFTVVLILPQKGSYVMVTLLFSNNSLSIEDV